MAVLKKIAGLVAGASAVAVIGVAMAQGVPPNPFVSNPALGAGQQSSHLTSMGETGVPGSFQVSLRTPPGNRRSAGSSAKPTPLPSSVS